MQHATFSRRIELKYLMSRSQKARILEAMEPYMKPDVYAHSTVRNLYCDTPTDLLIRTSLSHPIYKEKLRIRSYARAGMSEPVFLELKKKFDGVVYKRRIRLPQNAALAGISGAAPLPDSQIGRELSFAVRRYEGIQPKVFLSYDRDAYFAPDCPELRITFDENIRFRTEALSLDSDCHGQPLLPPNTVLMELKLTGSIPLWMAEALSREGIHKTAYSKYGAAHTLLAQQERTKNHA